MGVLSSRGKEAARKDDRLIADKNFRAVARETSSTGSCGEERGKVEDFELE